MDDLEASVEDGRTREGWWRVRVSRRRKRGGCVAEMDEVSGVVVDD
jgi:hypothetical protein